MRTSAPMFAALVWALSIAAPASAGDVSLMLATVAGRPVPNAVVTVTTQAGAKGPIRFPWAYRVAQKDMQFDPFVLIVPVGADVAFPNLDPYKHHVYSFSPAKTFELKLYGRDETRTVKFDKVGVVGVGCNIHDDMSAFIRVVDTPYAIKSGARGEAVIRDIPAGPATLIIWHPYQKTKAGEVSRAINIPASGTLELSMALDVRNPPLARGAY